MKNLIAIVTLLMMTLSFEVYAAEDPVKKVVQGALDTFTEGCQQELTTFCKDVTPGEARILACLYAFQDKLTPRCEYALYDSVNQLDRALNDLSYVVNECNDDYDKFCSDLNPGEGRILECLEKNQAEVSKRCNNALKTVGYK